MSLIRMCDQCGTPIDTSGPLGESSWVQIRVALDEQVRDGGTTKDYHRACARTITIAEAWAREGLIPL